MPDSSGDVVRLEIEEWRSHRDHCTSCTDATGADDIDAEAVCPQGAAILDGLVVKIAKAIL